MNEVQPSQPAAPTLDRATALARIREAVGPAGWLDAPEDVAPHLADQRGLFTGACAAVVRPASTEAVAAVVGACAAAGIGIVPQGGNTGLVGGSVPFPGFDGILLSLIRMNTVRAIDPLNNTITVDAGCILADIQAAAAEADRLFPLSLGAEGSCRIGGNLSTNAGGVNVLRYGNARELVLGLEVVLPDGRVWDGLRGLRKDNTGYALKHLFVGAEGTLGVITGAVLKLFPRPRDVQTAFAAIRDPAAATELLARLREGTGDSVTGYEILPRVGIDITLQHVPDIVDPLDGRYDQYLLIELSGPDAAGGLRPALETVLEKALEDGLVLDATIAESTAQARALWKLREELPFAQTHEGGSIKHDVAVPVSRVPDFLREATAAVEAALPGVRVFAFGHVGDGNIHFNLSEPKQGWTTQAFLGEWERMNRVVHDIVVSMGGSISAEHGIGRIKKAELVHYRSPVELDLMRTLKAALDPQGIMNPGMVL
jgi:FAD/FMN-containing dehydrogenase